MTEGGFFERKRMSPTSLVLVVTMHAAALGALALVKGPEIVGRLNPIDVFNVDPPPAPEPEPEPEPREQVQPREQPSRIEHIDPIVQPPISSPPVTTYLDVPDLPPVREMPPTPPPQPRAEPPRPEPVRIAAQVDPRFAGELQPPYPAAEIRAEREGTVRVRVTIGTDGRVKSIERLSATSDAFWLATQRHAMARWRFRPATVDGRPVESTKTMNVLFELRA